MRGGRRGESSATPKTPRWGTRASGSSGNSRNQKPQKQDTKTPKPQNEDTKTPKPQKEVQKTPKPQKEVQKTPKPQKEVQKTPKPQKEAGKTPNSQDEKDGSEEYSWKDVSPWFPDDLINRNRYKFCIFKVESAEGLLESFLYAWFKIETKLQTIQLYANLQASKDQCGRDRKFIVYYPNEKDLLPIDPNDDASTLMTVECLKGEETIEFVMRAQENRRGKGKAKK